MNKIKRIFIVGHMGAGRALLSDALAKRLGWQFIDANPGLERYIGRSLCEIFGKEGEAAFHKCEAEIISHYLQKEHVVVLLEEAVVATEENRKLLSSEFVVYAKVSIPVQMERLPKGRVPLLPVDDLKAILEQQHLERDSLYEKVAKFTVDTSSTVNVEDDVDKIMKEVTV